MVSSTMLRSPPGRFEGRMDAAAYAVVMSGELLTNAAIGYLRMAFDRMNSVERGATIPGSTGVSDDFRLEDRRTGGVNFGVLDRSGFQELLGAAHDVSSGRARWMIRRVLAVRGERIAAVEADIDYGNQDVTSLIYCFRLNSKLEQLERGLYLDLDGMDSAIAEVDLWDAEINQ